MPPRKASKPCHCPAHNGELLSENLWLAHQAALRAIAQEGTPIRNINPQRTPKDKPLIHEQMGKLTLEDLTLEELLPSPDVFADDPSAIGSDSEDKHERSR